MLRSIVAIIVSFVAVNALIIALFMATVFLLGIDGTLRPGEYWTTTMFNVTVIIGGAVISALGGALCAVIARSWRPALIVAGVMLALGLVSAVQNMNKPDPPARTPAVESETSAERMTRVIEELTEHGKEPDWFAFSVPFVGALAFIGGTRLARVRLKSNHQADEPEGDSPAP